MLSGTSLSSATLRVGQYYQTTGTLLANALQKIASGKKLQNPKDDIPDFFRSQKMQQNNSDLKTVSRQLREGLGLLSVAEKAGMNMFEDLNRMQELVKFYWSDSATADEKSFYKAEFDTLADHVRSTVADSYYGDRQLVQAGSALARIQIDLSHPETTIDITFSASHTPDVAALDITGPDQATVRDAVQTELDKAGRYLGRVTGFINSLEAHYNLTQKQLDSYTRLGSELKDADMAQEVNSVVKWQIRQQSSLAMLSQAHVASQHVLALFR
jgi:flagellin